MTKNKITKIVEEYLISRRSEFGVDLAINEKCTIEKNEFYVFYYVSKEWLNDPGIRTAIFDNYPIIVRKSDGEIFKTSFKYELDEYIEHFEKYGNLDMKGPTLSERLRDDYEGPA